MDLDEFLDSLMKTEREPKFPISMYYTEGTKYLNLFQYEKALEFLNEAIENDPTSLKSRLKRSKCFICLKQYKEAIDDADEVLKFHPSNVQAIDLKGQAQYLMGNYEGGYLTYIEGRKIRPMSNELRLGKQLCEAALNNSLNPTLRMKIKDADIESLTTPDRSNKRFEEHLRNRRSARECFGKDAKFLQDLLKDKTLTSVHGICQEAVDYIKLRERFWSMETPLHSRKALQGIKPKKMRKPEKAEKQMGVCNAAKRRAANQLLKGRLDDCISEVQKMLKFTESLPKDSEQEKMKLWCDAHHLLSLAHKKAGNTHLAFKFLLKELKAAHKFSLTLPQTRAYHQLGEIYQIAGDIRRALQCLDRVVTAMSPGNIEELAAESAEEEWQMQEAIQWATSVISDIKQSIRESIIAPVVETINEYSELHVEEDLKANEDVNEPRTIDSDAVRESGRKHTKSEDTLTTDGETRRLSGLKSESSKRRSEETQHTRASDYSKSKGEDLRDYGRNEVKECVSESRKDALKEPEKLAKSKKHLGESSRAKYVTSLSQMRKEIADESDDSEIPEIIEELIELKRESPEKLDELKRESTGEVDEMKKGSTERGEKLKRENTEESGEMKRESTGGIKMESTEESGELKKESTEELGELKGESTEKFSELKKEGREKSDELKRGSSEKVDELKRESTEKADEVKRESTDEVDEMKRRGTEEVGKLKRENTEESGEMKRESTDEIRRESVEELGGLKKESTEELGELKRDSTEKFSELQGKGTEKSDESKRESTEKLTGLKSESTEESGELKIESNQISGELKRGSTEEFSDFKKGSIGQSDEMKMKNINESDEMITESTEDSRKLNKESTEESGELNISETENDSREGAEKFEELKRTQQSEDSNRTKPDYVESRGSENKEESINSTVLNDTEASNLSTATHSTDDDLPTAENQEINVSKHAADDPLENI